MIQADMRSLFRELTNERSTAVVPDATIDLYMMAGLEALNRRVRYFYATDSSTVSFVAGTQEYAMPADCIDVVWVEWAGIELKKSSIGQWRTKGVNWRNMAQNFPEEWAFYGNKLVFLPTPSAAAVAKSATPTVRYVATPSDFTASGAAQLASQDHRLVVYYAVAEYSRAYPDSGFAAQRALDYQGMFDREAQAVGAAYMEREVKR